MTRHEPPQWAIKFLKWFCREDLLDPILGDLLEIYDRRFHRLGKRKANWLFVINVLLFFQPFAFKRKSRSTHINFYAMLQHALLINFRNFKKYKSQFFINLVGLSSGLVCVLFIILWVNDEKHIDAFHQNKDQLYQIQSNHTDASGITTWKGVPGLLLDEIESSVPEVKSAVATTDTHEYSLSVDESYFKANGKFASEGFFKVFSYPLLEGDGKEGLNDKSGILITASLAKRIFGTQDVIGRQLTWHFWESEKQVEVKGILKDIPRNSSDQFEFIMSWDYFHDDLIDYKNWGNYYGRIALVLNSKLDKAAAEQKIDAIHKEKQQRDNVDLILTKYTDNYLYSKYENGKQAGGRIEYVRLFTIVALFILFIACINFINLSTAKASNRTKEIGVKKSLGASRRSLISQYFLESLLLSVFSMLAALLVVLLLLPQFNIIADKSITFSFDIQLLLGLLSLTIIVAILAGSYPALYLSGIDPIKILKGKLSKRTGEVIGRKVLVVIQFTLSIILIVSVIVVYKQMDFVKNKNLGYDRDNLLYFEREGKILENSETFINELKNIPGVSNAMLSGFVVGGFNSTGGVSWEGKTPEDQIQFWETRSGHGLVEIMGMQLQEGRGFTDEFRADSSSAILNETAIKAMGMKDPIGKVIRHYEGDKTIVGVVKDFNLISLHTMVEPMIFLYKPEQTHFVMAKLEKGNEAETIERISDLYKDFNPGFVFDAQFVDKDYEALYASEERISVLSRYFAGFAIIISCLGLFGLAAFTAETRHKEIGIRKILGSSVVNIVGLLSFDFTKMVLVSIFIALPISFFIVSQWLNDFAYKIDLEWWLFAGAGLLALIVAWLTVGMQTIKAANINPTECLKSE